MFSLSKESFAKGIRNLFVLVTKTLPETTLPFSAESGRAVSIMIFCFKSLFMIIAIKGRMTDKHSSANTPFEAEKMFKTKTAISQQA